MHGRVLYKLQRSQAIQFHALLADQSIFIQRRAHEDGTDNICIATTIINIRLHQS